MLSLKYGLVRAEIRKRFLRPLQDSLDGSARDPELLRDVSDSFPGLAERENPVPMKHARGTAEPFALRARTTEKCWGALHYTSYSTPATPQRRAAAPLGRQVARGEWQYDL